MGEDTTGSPAILTFSAKKRKLSSLLEKFLQTKRTAAVPPPGWETGVGSDAYLREFQQDFEKVKSSERVSKENTDFISEDEVESSIERHEQLATTPNAKAKPMDMIDEGMIVQLKIFNLPYQLNEIELKDWGDKLGMVFNKVELEMRNDAFNGAARVWARMKSTEWDIEDSDESDVEDLETSPVLTSAGLVSKSSTSLSSLSLKPSRRILLHHAEVCRRLEGALCKSRPVRYKDEGVPGQERTQRTSLGGGNRYYERLHNIHLKCTRCGEVGHAERDCDNPERPMPCHLCAGADHDAASCPNLICFRCRHFGHNRNSCTRSHAEIVQLERARYRGGHPTGTADGGALRGVVCSQCGSLQHNFRFCPEIVLSHSFYPNERFRKDQNKTVVRASSLDTHKDVRCLTCHLTGHALCGAWPAIMHRRVPISQSLKNGSNTTNKKRPRETDNCIDDVVELVQERGMGVRLYCPRCGRLGHHCDYAFSLPSRDQERYYDRDDESSCMPEMCQQVNRFRRDVLQEYVRRATGNHSRHHTSSIQNINTHPPMNANDHRREQNSAAPAAPRFAGGRGGFYRNHQYDDRNRQAERDRSAYRGNIDYGY